MEEELCSEIDSVIYANWTLSLFSGCGAIWWTWSHLSEPIHDRMNNVIIRGERIHSSSS